MSKTPDGILLIPTNVVKICIVITTENAQENPSIEDLFECIGPLIRYILSHKINKHKKMTLGTLEFLKAVDHPEMVAMPVKEGLEKAKNKDEVWVAEIDPTLSDTAAFCEKYEIGQEVAANCVILRAKKKNLNQDGTEEEEVIFAACVILATTRTDVNGLMREMLGTKKISFAPMEDAVSKSGMEFGAITPVGLPAEWPIFIDQAVAGAPQLIIGSGLRKSKLLVSGKFLAGLPNVQVLQGLGQPKQ